MRHAAKKKKTRARVGSARSVGMMEMDWVRGGGFRGEVFMIVG
jgi:hypothetical protein